MFVEGGMWGRIRKWGDMGFDSRGIIVIFYNFDCSNRNRGEKGGETIKVDAIFSYGKCSLAAARHCFFILLNPLLPHRPQCLLFV